MTDNIELIKAWWFATGILLGLIAGILIQRLIEQDEK